MNKPKGYVTTASDPHADKTVMDLLKACPTRVFPVGRLDKNTTGVLMFTNDGEIAEKLTHPSYDKKKIYQVSLDSKLKQEDFEKILSGVELNDGVIAADELEYIEADDHRKLGIEMRAVLPIHVDACRAGLVKQGRLVFTRDHGTVTNGIAEPLENVVNVPIQLKKHAIALRTAQDRAIARKGDQLLAQLVRLSLNGKLVRLLHARFIRVQIEM